MKKIRFSVPYDIACEYCGKVCPKGKKINGINKTYTTDGICTYYTLIDCAVCKGVIRIKKNHLSYTEQHE